MDDKDGETRDHTRRVCAGKTRKRPLGSVIAKQEPATCLQSLQRHCCGVGGSLHRSRPPQASFTQNMNLSKEYIRYIASKGWKKLRAQSFARFGKRCQCCGSKKKVQGHHLIYREPLAAGLIDDIMPLCGDCHEIVHQTPKIDRGFRLLPHPNQRREFILRCFREIKPRVEPVLIPRAKPALKKKRITPKKPADFSLMDLKLRINAAKVRENLVTRACAVLGIHIREVSIMSSKALKRRMRHKKKDQQRKIDQGKDSIIAQMRAQAAANPNCTHFVFSVP